jgi:hypothetical protein
MPGPLLLSLAARLQPLAADGESIGLAFPELVTLQNRLATDEYPVFCTVQYIGPAAPVLL